MEMVERSHHRDTPSRVERTHAATARKEKGPAPRSRPLSCCGVGVADALVEHAARGIQERQGIVYAPSLDGNLYALGATSGELLWNLETDGAIVGTPAIVHEDLIAVPSTDGRLRVARLGDGVLEESCNIDEEIRTPLFEQDGMVYFGARDGSIRAISVSANGNPDEEWVHFTDRDDPVARDRIRAC